jgi:hypothetical protein
MAETGTKSVNFKFVVDQQSLAQVKTALQDLTQQALKFSEAMKSAGGGFFGGGNVGGGTAGKSVAQTAAGAQTGVAGAVGAASGGIKKQADEGVTALQKLTRELRSSVQQQKRDLSELTGALSGVTKAFGGLGGGLLGGVMRMGGPSYTGGGYGMLGPGGGGFSGSQLAIGGGGGGGFLSGLSEFAQVAGIGAGVAGTTFSLLRSMSMMPAQATAAQGAAYVPNLRAIAGGDYSTLGALRQGGQALAMQIGEQTGTMSEMDYWKSHPIDAIFAGPGAYQENLNAFRMGKINEIISARKNSLGYQRDVGLSEDYWNQSMGSRITGARLFGLEEGVGDAINANDPAAKKAKYYGDFHKRLQSRGYSEDQFYGAYLGIRNQAGNQATPWADAIMQAQAVGYDISGLVAAGTQSGFGGVNNVFGGPLGKNAAMAAKLGGLALTGFNPAGTTGGLGTLAGLQGGVELGQKAGLGDAFLVEQAKAGLQTGGTLFSDSSGLQAGRNLLSAIEATGPGGNTYAQVALSQLSFQQVQDIVRTGTIPDFLKDAGVNINMVKKYYESVANSALLDYAADDNSPASLAVKRYRASGLPLKSYLQQNPDQASALGSAEALSRPELGPEGAVFMNRMLATPEGKTFKAGRTPAGRLSKLQQAKADADAKTQYELERKLGKGGTARPVMEQEFQDAIKAAETGLYGASDAADKAAEHMLGLAGVSTKLRDTFQRIMDTMPWNHKAGPPGH